jgi:site-specific recombinase XerD
MQIVDINDSNNSDKENRRLYTNFIYSIKTEVSRQMYVKCLKYYMKFLDVKTLKDLIDKPQKIIESDIKEYLIHLRNQKKISYNTVSLYLSAIRKFYYVNSDYQFKWDLITSYLGNDDTDDTDDHNNNNSDLILTEREEQQDRPYSRTEIKQMFMLLKISE